ncbi:uncharacterized protein LOC142239971 [Haematobia irritans]|uniref:uncharacterized protein LOC142239971 n=1 Tax=Haematobia irritans TaxID=7368 RepID=UPI003F4F7593
MWLKLFLSGIIFLALWIRFWFRKSFSYWTRYNVPAARASIFSGSFMDFVKMKTNFGYHLKDIYDNPKFVNEAAVGVYGLYKPGLLIRDPNLLKAIFIKDFDKFCERSAQCDRHNDPLGDMNLFFARYPYWRTMRMKMSPVFSSGKIKNMYPLLQQVARRLEEHLHKRGDRFVDEFKSLFGRYSTDTISTTIMGFESNALENPEEPIYLEAVKLSKFNFIRAIAFMSALFEPRLAILFKLKTFYESTYGFLKCSIDKVLGEREKSGRCRNDLIDVFVKLKQEAVAEGEDKLFTMNGFYAQACILMSGGFDTSATTITNAFFELAQHPELMSRLREEIHQAFIDGGGEISYERLNSMEYLDMVMAETLRKYPVLPLLDRQYVAPKRNEGYSLKPFYNYEMPDGMPVYISVYALHYDTKYWPDPTKFDPERFSRENRKSQEPMSYLPFGSGPHNCVGQRLGQLQTKLAIAHVLKNHNVQICDRTNLNPRLDPKAFILHIEGGIHLEIVCDRIYVSSFQIARVLNYRSHSHSLAIRTMINLVTLFVVLTTFAIIFAKYWFQRQFRYWSQYKIPQAKASIFSGNLWDFISMKINFGYHLKTIYDDPKFQNEAIVGVYGVYTPGILIRDPELLKTVFIKDFDKFGSRSFHCNAKIDPIGNMALFFAPLKFWKGMRPKISPVFSSGKLKYMYPLLQIVAQSLENNLQRKGEKFVEDFKQLSTQFTTDSVATTIIGYESNALQNIQDPIYLEALELVKFNFRRAISWMVLLFMPQLSELFQAKICYQHTYDNFRKSVREVVTQRERTGHKRNDLIDIYVTLKEMAQLAGEDESYTMDSLTAQTIMLLSGGFETSSTMISSTLYELALQPDILERLRSEILDYLIADDGQISYERLNEMEYLRMVVEEALRKYPVLPLLDRRYLAADKKTGFSLKPYCDYEIPHGMAIYISTYGLHYDEKYWPNPTKFDPERFSKENRININPMTYLPFGSGPRNCVGSRLGLLQVKLALVHILKNHYVQLCDQTNINPQFDPKAFLLQIKGGIKLEVVCDNMFDNATGKHES